VVENGDFSTLGWHVFGTFGNKNDIIKQRREVLHRLSNNSKTRDLEVLFYVKICFLHPFGWIFFASLSETTRPMWKQVKIMPATKCSSGTLVLSSDIRNMRILARVQGINRQWGGRKRRFLMPSGATSSEPFEVWPKLSYISSCRFGESVHCLCV